MHFGINEKDKPKMSVSNSVALRFSTFFYLRDAQRGAKTILVPRSSQTLKFLTEQLIESRTDASEEALARYLLQILLETPKVYQILAFAQASLVAIYFYTFLLFIAHQLLFSYLQLVCFYAAQQVSEKLKSSANLKLHYPLEDCFLIASEAAIKPAKLLKRFNFHSQCPLYGYARTAINRTIQNQVVRDFKSKSLKLSDCGLLRSISPSRLETALREYGIVESELLLYRLAWQCFNDLWAEDYPVMNNEQRNNLSTRLNEQQCNLLVNRYRQQLQRLKVKQYIDGQEIYRKLTICIKAARSLQNKKMVSLESCGDLQDLSSNCLGRLLKEEKQQEISQVSQVIVKEFQSLDSLAQKSLLLWLGLGINQSDFIVFRDLQKQYQVARQFQSYQKIILKNFTLWCIEKNSLKYNQKKINQLCKENLMLIKECLANYCQKFFRDILDERANNLATKSKVTQINNFQRTNEQFFNKLMINQYVTTEEIQQEFTKAIEQRLVIKLNEFPSAEPCIAKFIQKWLQNN